VTKATAEDYRRAYPGVEISDAQAQERAERFDVRERRFQGYKGVRGIVVPELPWKKGGEDEK
jgi:hypothetical protein